MTIISFRLRRHSSSYENRINIFLINRQHISHSQNDNDDNFYQIELIKSGVSSCLMLAVTLTQALESHLAGHFTPTHELALNIKRD